MNHDTYIGVLKSVENSRLYRSRLIGDLIQAIRELPMGPNYERDRAVLVMEIKRQQDLFDADNELFDKVIGIPLCR